MGTKYEDIPVFRYGGDPTNLENLIGKSKVDLDEESKTVTITITSISSVFPEFLMMGKLQSLILGATITNVDPEVAKDYWSRQQ